MAEQLVNPTVARARDELTAAHVLAVSGLTAQSVSVALRGAVQAAEAALLLLDRVPPAGDAAVIAEFVRRVVRERGLDPGAGQRLRLLLNRHHVAEVAAPPPDEAQAAIEDARLVVDAVAEWLDTARRAATRRDGLNPRR